MENTNAVTTIRIRQRTLAIKKLSISPGSTSKIKIAEPTKVPVAKKARRIVRRLRDLGIRDRA
jgi:hypothetical protein